mmetsp:Transcript_105106/g.322210  ORF Transcript_105106/g.322210 Transcript_105106/m.322210 type:complete len:252 (-) Transcript_105106:279-1034(-)
MSKARKYPGKRLYFTVCRYAHHSPNKMSLFLSSTSHNEAECCSSQASNPANCMSVFQLTIFERACIRGRYTLSRDMPRFAPSIFSSTETMRRPPQNSRLRNSSQTLSSRVAAPRFFKCAVLGNFSLEPDVKKAPSNSSSSASLAQSSGPGKSFSGRPKAMRHFRSAWSHHVWSEALSPPGGRSLSSARKLNKVGWASACRRNATKAAARLLCPTALRASAATKRSAASRTCRGRCRRPRAKHSASRAATSP